MKKFTFIAALAFLTWGANAQTLEFTHEGEVVPDGTELEIKEYKVLQEGVLGQMDGEVFIKNTGTADVEASLTIRVIEGEDIGYCHFMDGTGTCTTIASGNSLTRTRTMKAGEEHDPEVHALGFIHMANPQAFYSVVEYKLEYGSTTKTITVKLNYDPEAASISSTKVGNSIFQAGNELSYSFDKAASRQLNIYSVTGAKVKNLTLENAGTVSLANLNKGIYLYEVVENGKRVAAHKCVVR